MGQECQAREVDLWRALSNFPEPPLKTSESMLFRTEKWANVLAVPANYPPSFCSLEAPALLDRLHSMFLMSDGLVPPLTGAGIWLILQAPIWLIKHKHLLGFWLACRRFQSEGDGEKVGRAKED
jgi:hypothetical protein